MRAAASQGATISRANAASREVRVDVRGPYAGNAAGLDVHFTPASASWINQVERWLAELA